MSAKTDSNLKTDNLANEDCRPVPCSHSVFFERGIIAIGNPNAQTEAAAKEMEEDAKFLFDHMDSISANT
jgi:hypothetical protein